MGSGESLTPIENLQFNRAGRVGLTALSYHGTNPLGNVQDITMSHLKPAPRPWRCRHTLSIYTLCQDKTPDSHRSLSLFILSSRSWIVARLRIIYTHPLHMNSPFKIARTVKKCLRRPENK